MDAETDDTSAQMERIRSKLVDFIGSNPGGPDADQARRILGKLPKVHAATNDTRSMLPESAKSFGGPGSVDRTETVEAGLPTRDTNLLRMANRASRQEAQAPQDVRDIGGALNSAADRYTFGLYGAALRAAGGLSEATGTPNSIASQAAHSIEDYRHDNPGLATITDAPAYIAEGPVQSMAQGIERLIPQASTALGRMGRAGLASAGASGVIGGSEAATAGESPTDVARAAGHAALAGLGGGTAIAGAGELAGAAARRILGSRGGQARRFIEERGGEVGPGGVKLKGDFETMGTSDEDIGRQAEVSAKKGLDILEAKRRAEVSNPYAREIARIKSEAEAASEAEAVPHEVLEGNATAQLPRQSMRELVGATPEHEYPMSRSPSDEEAAAADRVRRPTVEIPTEPMRKMLGLPEEQVPASSEATRGEAEVAPEDIIESRAPRANDLRDVRPIYSELVKGLYNARTNPEVSGKIEYYLKLMDKYTRSDGQILMTEETLNDLRANLNDAAKAGRSTEARLNPLQNAAATARKMVNQGPYAEANRAYNEGSASFRQSRRLLRIPEQKTTPEESTTTIDKVKNLITRRGQNTVTVGGQNKRLADFEARHPDVAAEFEKPELLRKRADISFHLLPRHGGLLDRMTGGHHGIAAAIGLGAGGVTGALPALTLTNLPAIQARLLYGPAMATQRALPYFIEDVPQLQSPLLAAARAREERH